MITGVIATDEYVMATHLQRACLAALSFASGPEESIGTTYRSRDCSMWESDTLHWDTSQHCVGRSPLPKCWAVLAARVRLKTRTVWDAGWGGLPAVKDYWAYILWHTVCADCYLVGATQSVAECGCVCAPIHISARHCFVLVLLLCKEASIHQKDQL